MNSMFIILIMLYGILAVACMAVYWPLQYPVIKGSGTFEDWLIFLFMIMFGPVLIVFALLAVGIHFLLYYHSQR